MNILTIFWLVSAVVFAIIEISTVGLVSVWFCIASIVSCIMAYFGSTVSVTFIAFVIISAILVVATRPIIKSKFAPNTQFTNADRIIGKSAVVTTEIDSLKNTGQIKVEGQIWSAKSKGNIPAGETVVVEAIEGVKAVVTK